MIQRIQTVFLLLAIAAIGLFLWLPLIGSEINNHPGNSYKGYELFFRYNGYLYFVNAILAGTAAGITFINIFLYKRRNLQILLCYFAILFIIAAQALVYYQYYTWIFIGDLILRKWNLFSLVAVAAEILAVIYIRRDEETIKSLDRLR